MRNLLKTYAYTKIPTWAKWQSRNLKEADARVALKPLWTGTKTYYRLWDSENSCTISGKLRCYSKGGHTTIDTHTHKARFSPWKRYT